MKSLEEMVHLVRSEYLEMPGLRLTAAQAQRFWNLPQDQCEQTMAALVGQHFLHRTETGVYLQRTTRFARWLPASRNA